jgi:hypothetical protein
MLPNPRDHSKEYIERQRALHSIAIPTARHHIAMNVILIRVNTVEARTANFLRWVNVIFPASPVSQSVNIRRFFAAVRARELRHKF